MLKSVYYLGCKFDGKLTDCSSNSFETSVMLLAQCEILHNRLRTIMITKLSF